MGNNNSKGNVVMKGNKPVSQKAQLDQIRKTNIMILALGIVLVVVSFAMSIMASVAKDQQLTVTMALDQYRLGSKSLTEAIQAYSVTGDEQYKESYYAEIETVKNRDTAIATLKKEGLKASEWASLDEIQALSEGMVPLEEEAMRYVGMNQLYKAQTTVFGAKYLDTVTDINALTDKLISTVQNRLAVSSNVCSVLQTISQVVLMLAFLFIAKQFLGVIKFSENELLVPIEKVSVEMQYLAQGDFDQVLDMSADESEVDRKSVV